MKIINGDSLIELKKLEDNSVDSVVTDPPYGLSFMGKKWDYNVPSVELWQEVFRVLKPGGHLLSFAGTRTQHRMAVNIEDAGFEIRDMIAWVYGSGFPKSHNIEKAINKIDGVKFRSKPASGVGFMKPDSKDWNVTKNQLIQEEGNSDRAKHWEGWGTALKPALEPITLARKPLSEKTIAANVLKWGVGGINIDESRVETQGEKLDVGGRGKHNRGEGYGFKPMGDFEIPEGQGRFPANLIHNGSEEVVSLFPKTNPSKSRVVSNKGSIWGSKNSDLDIREHNDNGGSAARFFYCAKASKSERNAGLEGTNTHSTVKPIKLMEYLVRLITPKGGVVLDPFMGSGSTGIACKKLGFSFIGIDLEKEYCDIAEARINNVKL